MTDTLAKCAACNGRGYHRCGCWPGDCICGQDDEPCWECAGEGWVDPSYDDFVSYPETPAPQQRASITKEATHD